MTEKNKKDCLPHEDCMACSKKIITWSIAGSIFLAILKFVSGALSRSAGLTADGIQSLSCVIGSMMIMYSLMIAKKKPNNLFPYGYGKIEFIVALVVFSSLIGLGFFISLSSVLLLLKRNLEVPDIRSLPVAAISVFINFLIYKYSFCAGKQLNSSGIIANAHQSKADMFSSIAVGIGILLSQIGKTFAIFDPLAAFLVGVLILKDSFHHWFINLKVILDKIPDPEYRNIIRKIVMQYSSNTSVSSIKFRRTGKMFWLGISLDCPPNDNLGKIELATNLIKDKLQSDLSWAGDVDFFIEG